MQWLRSLVNKLSATQFSSFHFLSVFFFFVKSSVLVSWSCIALHCIARSTHPESGSIDKFVDGSMEADLPMQQISELFNINHFIVSQVTTRRPFFFPCIFAGLYKLLEGRGTSKREILILLQS